MHLRPLIVMSVAMMLLAACAGGSDSAGAPTTAEDGRAGVPRVVVTTTILGDVVGALAADDAAVEVLLPAGADPHDFALSASQAESLRSADLIVVNGGGLEEGLVDAVEAAAEDGVEVFEATAVIDTIDLGEAGDDHAREEHDDDADEDHDDDQPDADDDDHHEHDGADPHFWHDPLRMATVVEALAEQLADLDDTVADDVWATRAEALREDLEALDAEVRQTLSVIPEEDRVLITNHDALGYLADAYDFRIAGTVIPGGATLAEPSAADLEALVAIVDETGVPAIFAETTDASRLAEVVAAEAGRDVAVEDLHTDSLSEAGGPAATYADFMLTNAATIAAALG